MKDIIAYSSTLFAHTWRRVFLGFVVGFAFMGTATRVFIVNSFDYANMLRGIQALFHGVNPWDAGTRVLNFYNPPFALFFLWPMLWVRPQVLLILGGGLLSGYAFYRRAWVALGWFVSAEMLWLIAAGGIDMYVVGMGLWALALGDRASAKWLRTSFYVVGYGFLLVKPQGGVFIVLLHIWLRRNWGAILWSVGLYGILFAGFYPQWLRVLITDPPPGHRTETHAFAAQFGIGAALVLALMVLWARPWAYWSLGGALSAILSPYGMPGVPLFLILTSVRTKKALLMFVLFSSALTLLTWNTPPPDIRDYYAYVGKFLRIYHLGMQAYALSLAVLEPTVPGKYNRFDIRDVIRGSAR